MTIRDRIKLHEEALIKIDNRKDQLLHKIDNLYYKYSYHKTAIENLKRKLSEI